jgi:hypothetical protein
MLSKTFWKLLSISLTLKGNRSEEKKKKNEKKGFRGNSDGEGIYRNK